MANTKWTDAKIQASADRYGTRGEWKKGDFNAYKTAHRSGLINKFCGHMTVMCKTWTDAKIKASADRYQTRNEWIKGDKNAYQAAHRRGLARFCGHMTVMCKTWTDANLQTSADRYQTRKEWQKGDVSAYNTACSRGLLEQFCGHMVSGFGATDNDAIYIWLVAGLVFNGLPVYKIGVTSHRLGDARIQQCAKANDMMPRIVKLAQVEGIKATDIEGELHSLGQTVDCIPQGADGYTEFRALTNDELRLAIDVIELAEII